MSISCPAALNRFHRLAPLPSAAAALAAGWAAPQEWLLLGRWIGMARAWGATAAEKAHLEFNARNVLTLWGPNGEIAGPSPCAASPPRPAMPRPATPRPALLGLGPLCCCLPAQERVTG